VNGITNDSFLLPRTDFLDMLTGTKWFLTLDLKSGYWYVTLHLSNKENTLLSAEHELCQFIVTLVGLFCASAMLEHLMESILRDHRPDVAG
jgi:hypothetical protein